MRCEAQILGTAEAIPRICNEADRPSPQMLYPRSTEILSGTPEWAQAIMEKALEIAIT